MRDAEEVKEWVKKAEEDFAGASTAQTHETTAGLGLLSLPAGCGEISEGVFDFARSRFP